MMGKTQLVIGLHFLVISVFLQPARADNRREDLIQDSMRRLLGMKPGTERTLVPGKNTTLPPQYVMDLYEKYRSGHAPMQGNTVRSILPIRDSIGEGEVLIFNLTSINPSEQILQSKLYLLKRRRAKSGRKRDLSNFRIKIGNLPQMTSHRYIEVSLSHQKSEWHAYDITESVVQCRHSKKQRDQLLGVTLEVKRPRGNYRLVPFRRLLKHNSQPFVLIFSEDSANQTRGSLKINRRGGRVGIQDLLSSKVDPDTIVPGNHSRNQDFSRELMLRRKRSLQQSLIHHTSFETSKTRDLNNYHYAVGRNSSTHSGNRNHSHDNLNNKTRKSLFSIRKKLLYSLPTHAHSTMYNDSNLFYELRNNSMELLNIMDFVPERRLNRGVRVLPKVLLNNVLKFAKHKGVQQRNDTEKLNIFEKRERKKRSISTSFGPLGTPKNSREEHTTANAFQDIDNKYAARLNSSAVPLPRRQNRQRNRRKHKKKRRRNRKLPFWWTKHDKNLHSQDYHKICQRKSLIVDFEKLGWGDWIMSPKSFNAYYCSGGCSFPIIKDANPSNHAAIQSLMNAMRLGLNVPAPCCVPSVTKPLTLLYFDENNSLVLKNYPNMVVEKCACR